eukprot:1777286-Alexandrium_andersonii.AAC.1
MSESAPTGRVGLCESIHWTPPMGGHLKGGQSRNLQEAASCDTLQLSCSFLQAPAAFCSLLRCSSYIVPRLLLADS